MLWKKKKKHLSDKYWINYDSGISYNPAHLLSIQYKYSNTANALYADVLKQTGATMYHSKFHVCSVHTKEESYWSQCWVLSYLMHFSSFSTDKQSFSCVMQVAVIEVSCRQPFVQEHRLEPHPAILKQSTQKHKLNMT